MSLVGYGLPLMLSADQAGVTTIVRLQLSVPKSRSHEGDFMDMEGAQFALDHNGDKYDSKW